MKAKETARKMAYVGAGAGIILFAVGGLLPGSLLGGVMGLNVAGSLFGFPLSSSILPRLVVGISMLLGVFGSALMFIAGCSSLGWLIGWTVDSFRIGSVIKAEARN